MEPLIYVFENLSDELIVGMVKRSTIKQLGDMQVILKLTTPENQKRWENLITKTLNIGGSAQ